MAWQFRFLVAPTTEGEDDEKIHSTTRTPRQQAAVPVTNDAAGAASMIFPAGLLHAQTATSTLRVRLGSDIALLDPGRFSGRRSQTVSQHLYNGLVKYDRHHKIVRILRGAGRTSPDGSVYTFRLRDGVTWHKKLRSVHFGRRQVFVRARAR
jgi:MarR-like DNA-binding transcriptional regulator SgrR of sgrS sRNA